MTVDLSDFQAEYEGSILFTRSIPAVMQMPSKGPGGGERPLIEETDGRQV